MSCKKAPTKSTKKNRDILEYINAGTALEILQELAGQDEDLRARIEQMALAYLGDVDLEEIAAMVYFTLDSIQVEDLWDQSGGTRYGYVDPTDRAWEMFEEALEPFVDELKKYKKLSMSREAKIYFKGLLKGIYKFEKESTSEFKGWAADAPEDYFESVLEEWKEDKKEQDDIAEVQEFIKKNLPDWP